ncbi:MAG: cation-translocating P-type ATPase, partial [Muribaculaceae bacterium]
LSINESTLTGEPVIKKSHRPADFKSDVTYPTNHAMRGTTITEGHGVLRVLKVGDATEYGKVYEAAQIDNGVKTPLTLQFEKLGKLISYASYAVGFLIIIGRLAIYDYTGATFDTVAFIDYSLTTLMLAITLIVVSVPEGLPMSVTLSLALSMRRMLATNNLVRKMHACETMGATTIICTDKTGTLTQNQMRIYEEQFFALPNCNGLSDSEMSKIVTEGIACNSTAFLDYGKDNDNKVVALGNPTEGALLLWLNANGIDYMKLREKSEIVEQLPFSTERKYMATIVESNELKHRIVYVKGAPEIVMAMSKKIAGEASKEEITAKLLEYQGKAMRTLGFAYQILEDGENPIKDGLLKADKLTFIGIVAISDPVRADVPTAIRESIGAGIDVKIVTGDTPGTAKEIGRQVGLWTDDCTDINHISGPDFAALTDDEARNRVHSIKIMSRARPTDKSRLVGLLQGHGDVVAVTGDGTNDAPALNAAQVGLSMGDGTSVAKEASDITIMDNSFSSITKAVMWGRSLYQNIQRFILFQLTVNLVACVIVVIGAFTGQESPLTVTQMLWVNLIMDTFAALALASLPPSAEVMKNKPRKSTDFIINRTMAWFILGVGAIFILFLFGILQYFKHVEVESLANFDIIKYFQYYFDFGYPVTHGLTPYDLSIFFSTFVFLQFWNLFNAKAFQSGHSSFWNMRESKVFFTTLLAIVIGQVIIVYCGGEMFNVVPLKIIDLARIFVGTSVVMLIGEFIHLFKCRKA